MCSPQQDFIYPVSASDDPVLNMALSKSEALSVIEQADIVFNANKSDSLSLSEVESKQISKALNESVSITESLVLS